ncbi:MAG: DUF3237 family protein [Chloroflexota bacterium]
MTTTHTDGAIGLRFVMEVLVEIDPALEVGQTPTGLRRVIPITGGSFEGPGMRGAVLSGGADWNLRRSDGVAEVWARYTLQTDDGALIMVTNAGLGRGEHFTPERYARTVPSFEVGPGPYEWLARSIFVGTLERRQDGVSGVKLRFFEVV